MRRKHPYILPMTKVLSEHRIERFSFEQRKNHPRLVFEHGGRKHQITMPGSPSDGVRGAKKAVSFLRRYIKELS